MKRKISKSLVILIYVVGFSLPLIITLGRILIPDTSYDTINYHTFIGARGWDWQSFSKIEFYPLGLRSFFPLLDMINSLGQKFLGYRLGTLTEVIFFYLSILLIFLIINSLKLSTGNKFLDAFLKINTFISLEALFQLASYFTDIISSFLILLFIYTLINFKKNGKFIFLLLSTLIISLSVLCKYTNYIYFMPYIILLVEEIIKKNTNTLRKIQELLGHFSIYVIINGPWMVWNYINTHNPIFPYFNSIFRSEYFQATSWAFNQGPKNIFESISYPIFLLFNNTRLGEYHELIPDYKFSLYIIILIISYPIIKTYNSEEPEVWYLYKYFLLCYVSWVLVFGYARYGIALEFLAGILLIALFSKYLKKIIKYKSVIAIIVVSLFLWQDIYFVMNNLKYDISWRPNLWFNESMYIQEYKNLFNNNNYYPKIEDVDVYLNCGSPNLGYMVPSNLVSLPVIALTNPYNAPINELNYRLAAINRIPGINEKKDLIFVTIIKDEGSDLNYKECISILDSYGANITNTYGTSFLGYENINFKVVKGHINLKLIIN